ncbi:MAG: gamma-glutamylcyclotransferase [Verrucomicrobia bacterium]|nr:gamma-glutamylcyclotransferase [Verrucomicrobiota bacterium]
MLYFAYGSNMDWERMTHASRAAHAQFLFKALLPNHKLAFTCRTDAGTGAADIVPAVGNAVWGVVYHIEPEDRENLDRRRGVLLEECRPDTVVLHPEGDLSRTLKAFTYVVCRKLATHQPPTRQYLNWLLNGARQARLPDAYIETLQRIETLR